MIQVREPAWSDQRVRDLILRLRESLTDGARSGVEILVNGRWNLARDLELAGVHLGRSQPKDVGSVKLRLGSKFLVGYSAHSLDGVLECAAESADYVSFSPIFGAISKRHPLPPVGLAALETACGRSSIPVYALGGIRPEHAADVRRSGAAGAMSIGSILDVEDPGAAVERFLASWDAAAKP